MTDDDYFDRMDRLKSAAFEELAGKIAELTGGGVPSVAAVEIDRKRSDSDDADDYALGRISLAELEARVEARWWRSRGAAAA